MKTERNGDEVFSARVGLGLRELDGLERAPDVSADVLRRLGEREAAPRRPAFAWLAVVAALLAIAVTTTLLVLRNGDRNSRDRAGAVAPQDPAPQEPQGQDPVGAWRLVYEVPLEELQRALADHRKYSLEELFEKLVVHDLQQRLGALAVVAPSAGATVEVTFANAAAGDVAAARALLENPGQLALRVLADSDYFADKVGFSMAEERQQLQSWLDGGGRERLQRDRGAIAEYRSANENLRWFVHLVRPSAAKAGAWGRRFADTPQLAASTIAAHAESEWNGGTIPASVQALPVERQFLVELVAINMHARHFRETDILSASVALATDEDGGAAVDYRVRQSMEYAAFSEQYIGKCCAVIWNDEVLMAPRFVSPIHSGAGRIGGLSAAQAATIAKVLATRVAVRLRLLRSGNNVIISRKDADRFRDHSDDFLEHITVDTYSGRSGTTGLIVKAVDAKLASFGVTAGDVLLEINGRKVGSKAQAVSAAKSDYNRGVRTFTTKWLAGGQVIERVFQSPPDK